MKAETQAAAAARRSAWYWLLAELFLTCPNDEVVARWRHDLSPDPGDSASREPAGTAVAAVAGLHSALPEAGDSSALTEMAAEYTRLFGAIRADYGPPPPYESVHRKAGEPADMVLAVNQFFNEAGFAPIDQAVPPDHLGVELRFVALLCHAEMEAWQQERAADALELRRWQREFFGRHLLQWVPQYFDAVLANSQHPFYRELAVLARKTMMEDKTFIEDCYVA